MCEPNHSLSTLQRIFVDEISPKVERRARFAFAYLQRIRPGEYEDKLADALGAAWKLAVQLNRDGKDAAKFAWSIAVYGVRHVRVGRAVNGQGKRKCVLNRPETERLPCGKIREDDPAWEALRDNTQSPVPDQAAFRIDFPQWRDGLPERDQRIVGELQSGASAKSVAHAFRVSPGRISQLRQRYFATWKRFHGESAS